MDNDSAVTLLETYTITFYIGAVLCALFLTITLILFFKYNIIEIIGDLSGVNARKGIENIRNQNRATGNKAHKSSHINLERGKITDKISKSGNLLSAGESVGVSVGTEKIHTGKLVSEKSSVLGVQETSVLGVMGAQVINETTVLGADYSTETTVLTAGVDETTVLSEGSDQTTVLGMIGNEPLGTDIVIEEEIIFVHSYEQIN